MGCYVNPPNELKEDWLKREGTDISWVHPGVKFDKYLPDRLIVCLVFNGGFTAAAVAYSQRELDEFSSPDDMRPKIWFTVPVKKLREVSNLDSYFTE